MKWGKLFFSTAFLCASLASCGGNSDPSEPTGPNKFINMPEITTKRASEILVAFQDGLEEQTLLAKTSYSSTCINNEEETKCYFGAEYYGTLQKTEYSPKFVFAYEKGSFEKYEHKNTSEYLAQDYQGSVGGGFNRIWSTMPSRDMTRKSAPYEYKYYYDGTYLAVFGECTTDDEWHYYLGLKIDKNGISLLNYQYNGKTSIKYENYEEWRTSYQQTEKKADYEYEWYKNRSLALEEGASADKLLGYLEDFDSDPTAIHKIKNEFGSKFILTFVTEKCQNCKEAVEGYEYAISSGWVEGFKLYSILVDQLDADGKEYLAKSIYQKHNDLFERIVEYFGECEDIDYSLYRNLNAMNKHSQVVSMKEKTIKLSVAAISDEGLDTPLTLMIDVDKAGGELYGTSGVIHVIYNYIDFDYSLEINAATKGMVVRDFWNNKGLFNPEVEA